MTEVENLIYQFDNTQREIMLFFHSILTNGYSLTSKITFKNPCYYKKSWICYLKPLKNEKIELAFMRGNELSNNQGLLKSNGRKQLRSIEFSNLKEIPLETIKEILHEAILLDETKPYESKRKS
ncbi:DUF1801 domain-containing protein [Flavivirga amylovorans]|uniref:DUF1801 domain-containing protein n=1 Tax=Flavivirga amylovorans TaxID=870486 RepID=A0ABT8X6L6_9FLAO|nr:DUF1801 domain-containing protein [Flavivirga amylovorans]MDO5989317.1 DUF1801 domain-containing protein [Flavivirga amylovorans]